MTEARTISVSIRCPVAQAYDFLSRPQNFPRWASGLCSAIEPDGDEWVAQTPQGPARVRFSDPNAFGVLDHSITFPNRVQVSVPMRVVPNGQGSELLLTLFRDPAAPENFERDAEWVARDLAAVKALLESQR